MWIYVFTLYMNVYRLYLQGLMWVYACIHTYLLHIYAHIYIYIYSHMYRHTLVRMQVNVQVHIHPCSNTHSHTRIMRPTFTYNHKLWDLHCTTLQHTVKHSTTLHLTIPHCTTLQHTTSHDTTLTHTTFWCKSNGL